MNKLNQPNFLLNNKIFQTIYGRNLLSELNIIIPNETLVVTMEDLWENFSSFFKKDVRVHLVKNLDINTLENDYEKIKNFNAVVGFGGGQALDTAKFFSWKRFNSIFYYCRLILRYFKSHSKFFKTPMRIKNIEIVFFMIIFVGEPIN